MNENWTCINIDDDMGIDKVGAILLLVKTHETRIVCFINPRVARSGMEIKTNE